MRGFVRLACFLGNVVFAAACPAWLDEYTAFHARSRGEPDASTLTYAAFENGHGGGFGDRFRAMQWGLRLAAATKRVFYIHVTRPFALEHMFTPSLINWRGGPSFEAGDMQEVHMDGRFGALPTEKHVVYGGIPEAHAPLVWGARVEVDHSAESDDLSCMFKSLFRPSDLLRRHVDDEERSIFGRVDTVFTAIHMRTGGAKGEGTVLDRGHPLSNLLGAISCARRWPHDILMVATHPALRKAAHDGWLSRVHGPRKSVISFSSAVGLDPHMPAFVEIVLMSRAACFVQVRGGLGDAARWLGNITRCVRFVGVEREPGAECWTELAAELGASVSWT